MKARLYQIAATVSLLAVAVSNSGVHVNGMKWG